MNECEKYEASCSPTPSVNHLLRASAIVATGVFLAITIVLLICILHKRRLIVFARFRGGAQGAQHPPALYVWSAPASNEPAAAPAAPPPQTEQQQQPARGKPVVEPLSCVVMAGDERPTYLARPLPTDQFVDVRLDPTKLDELERGKRKGPLYEPRH